MNRGGIVDDFFVGGDDNDGTTTEELLKTIEKYSEEMTLPPCLGTDEFLEQFVGKTSLAEGEFGEFSRSKN